MTFLEDGAWYATGIGSLPHSDAATAVQVILDNLGEIPHWPQLPARGAEESFARQFLGHALDVGVFSSGKDGKVRYVGDGADAMAKWYECYLQACSRDDYGQFGLDEKTAAGCSALLDLVSGEGLIKGQVSGPLTVGFAINDHELRAVWYDDQIRDLIVRSLSAGAKWQVRALRETGRQVILFVDEPGLFMFGQSSFVAVSRDAIVNDLCAVLTAAREESALTGVHVCAGCDWSIVMECPVDIVSFDAGSYLPSLLPYTDHIAAFLARGGMLAWGAVPTTGDVERTTPDLVLATIRNGMDALANRGVNRTLMVDRAMITPACGTGTLSVAAAEHVYRLTRQVQDMLRCGDGLECG